MIHQKRFDADIKYETAIACPIDKTLRSLPQPSDHTPVVVELAI
jgi:exonuclease III